jgi:transcriptional regulator with XRE-family HTH domain
MGPLCDDPYAGTREGLILVSKALPEAPQAPETRNGDGANGDRRRAELADFLRARREGLQPADVGLPGGGRRRTPGLRREEVALLAGVGTTWYTWLEQGRDVRPSLEVVDALSGALRLTPAERGHLVVLARGEAPPPPVIEPERVSPTVRRLIANLGASPAYLIGRRWDLLAWNDAYVAVFGDPMARPPEERNQVWLHFLDPGRRALVSDWSLGARRLIARFRADHARHLGDPAFERLVGALMDASPEFRRWWPRHEVLGTGEGRKDLRHPVAGRLAFEHAVFHHGESSDQRLLLYSPLPDHDTPAKLARLLAA